MNRIWDEDQISDLEVGQLPPEEADYVQDDRWVLPQELQAGRHICHPEWLTVGEPWPSSLPNTVYNFNGVPQCCCVDEYEVFGPERLIVSSLGNPLAICWSWFGSSPPGQNWRLNRQLAPGPPYWLIEWNWTGLPSPVQWLLNVPWDGRGTSPPFDLDGPTLPPLPPTLYVREVVA